MLKLSKKAFKSKNFAIAFTSKRNYAEQHHHEDKNECYISESYMKKWGFLTEEEYDRLDVELENDLKSISERHAQKREEIIKSWTPAQKYPWYSSEQLEMREKLRNMDDRLLQIAELENQKELEREKRVGPFDSDAVFGEKSRVTLWKRYFARNGNKSPQEPKSTIRVTCDAPFDTSSWQFHTLPVHCERHQEIENHRLHPTRRLAKKYMYYWVDNGFKRRGIEYTAKDIESFSPEVRKKYDQMLKEDAQMKQELDELLSLNIDRVIYPTFSLHNQDYQTFLTKLNL